MPFARGAVINGKYQIIEMIGVGGLGFVVAALHVELGEKVALKFLRPEALTNSEAVGRFAREARASAKIQSEHVARVFDVGSLPNGAPFIVMEYLDGTDLAALLQERGALPVPLAIEYVLQTCEALAAAHVAGIVHRDIKPDNLFVNRQARGVDVIKVLDFGISKVAAVRSAFEIRHPLAETTMAMGSPIYMSPEQIRASKDIDTRTDIWSLGCVLYELLTNRLAFDAATITEVTALILERETPLLRAARPDVPAELEFVIQRCLAKSPNQRFQNVAELAAALAPFASPRGRMAVERCQSIVYGAGMPRQPLERLGSVPPDELQRASWGPSSGGASSTSTVEAPLRASRAPARTWPAAIAALMLTAGAAGVFLAPSEPPTTSDLPATPVQPAAPAGTPAGAPPRTHEPALVPVSPTGALVVAASARDSAAQPAHPGAAAGAAPAFSALERAPEDGALPVNAAENVSAPAAGAAAKTEPTTASGTSSEAGRASLPRAEPVKQRSAPAAPRRRVTSAPPKPKPAASARPTPTVREEPDVGF